MQGRTHVIENDFLGVVDSDDASWIIDVGDETLEELGRFLENVDQASNSLAVYDIAENLKVARVMELSGPKRNYAYRSFPRDSPEQWQVGFAIFKHLGPGTGDRRQSDQGILTIGSKTERKGCCQILTLGTMISKPLTVIVPPPNTPSVSFSVMLATCQCGD
jgi:hypothetical protein